MFATVLCQLHSMNCFKCNLILMQCKTQNTDGTWAVNPPRPDARLKLLPRVRFWGSGCFRTYLWPHPPPPSKSSDWVGSTPTKRIYNIVTTTHPPLISLGWKKGVDNLFNLKEPASPWFRPVCKPQLIHFSVNLIFFFFKIAFFLALF